MSVKVLIPLPVEIVVGQEKQLAITRVNAQT